MKPKRRIGLMTITGLLLLATPALAGPGPGTN